MTSGHICLALLSEREQHVWLQGGPLRARTPYSLPLPWEWWKLIWRWRPGPWVTCCWSTLDTEHEPETNSRSAKPLQCGGCFLHSVPQAVLTDTTAQSIRTLMSLPLWMNPPLCLPQLLPKMKLSLPELKTLINRIKSLSLLMNIIWLA